MTSLEPVFLLIVKGKQICFDVFLVPLLAWYIKSWPIEEIKRETFADFLCFFLSISSKRHVVKNGTLVSFERSSLFDGGQLLNVLVLSNNSLRISRPTSFVFSSNVISHRLLPSFALTATSINCPFSMLLLYT